MHFPRIAWTAVLSVSLLSSPLLNAADDNPFAKWEQQRLSAAADSRGESPSAAESRNGNVEYFSATASDRQEQPAATATGVKRERLRSKPAAAISDASDPAPAKMFNTPTANAPAEQPASGVRVAAFGAQDNRAGIRQTSGTSRNPFAEFLTEEAAEAETLPTKSVDEAATETVAAPAAPAAVPEFEPAEFDLSEIEAAPTLPAQFQGPQTPSVTLQWQHHDEFIVGQECRCDLIVENSGRTAVRDVTTEVALPRGLRVIKAEPAPSSTDMNARWTFNELQPGERRALKLTVVPGKSGDIQMNAFVQLTGAVSSGVSVTQPEVAIKLEGPASVGVGQQIGYTVHVTNPGTGTARNVVIQAAVPDGLEHRQGKLLTIEIGTLSPGELRRARLSLAAVKGGEHKLAVRVLADGDLTKQTTQVVEVAEPKLNIGIRGPASRKTGQEAEFEVAVINEGKVESNNVRAKYKLPAGFEFVRADAGGKFDAADGTIEWFVGTLEPDRARQFNVVLKATEAGESNHQVGVLSEHGRMTLAEHQTMVEGKAVLDVKVTCANRQGAIGEDALFEVRIENTGSSAAELVGLSCELPTGLELLDISGPSEFIADNGVVIFRSLPQLEAGKTAVFEISTRSRRAGRHNVRVRVASESISDAVIGEAATSTSDQ